MGESFIWPIGQNMAKNDSLKSQLIRLRLKGMQWISWTLHIFYVYMLKVKFPLNICSVYLGGHPFISCVITSCVCVCVRERERAKGAFLE